MAYTSIRDISDIASACNGQNMGKRVALVKMGCGNYTQLAYSIMELSLSGENSNIFTFFFVEAGEMTLTMDYMEHKITARSGFSLPPTAIVTSVKISEDIKGYAVVATSDYVEEVLLTRRPISISQALFLKRTRDEEGDVNGHRFSHPDFLLLRRALENMEIQLKRTSHHFYKELVNSAFATLIYESTNILLSEIKNEESMQQPNGTDLIINKFIKLLTAHGDEEHSPAFYADKLCISVQYLSLILKRLSGYTANDWIAGFLISRAKVMLRNPSYTIQQITAILCFSDQSSFGKFFKKHTGITPKQYKDEFLRY